MLAGINWLIFTRFLPRHGKAGDAGMPDRKALARFFGWDYLGTLASMAAMGIAPLVVLHYAGAASLAAYYISWEVAYGVYLISRSMGVSLLAEAAVDRTKLRRLAIDAMLYTALPLGFAVLLLLAGAPYLLALLGKQYGATDVLLLRLLALSCLPWSVVTLSLAGARVTGRMETVAVAQIVTLVIVLGLGTPLVVAYGAVGMAGAWLVAHCVVALGLVLALLRRLGPSGRTDAGLNILAAAARLRSSLPSFSGRREAPLTRPLADFAAVTGLGSGLRILREFRRESDVRTALIAGAAGERLIFKTSTSAEGRRALSQHVLRSRLLAENPRLEGLAFKLSEVVASKLTLIGAALAERAWTGEDGRSFLASRRRHSRGLECALAGIGEIHDRTAVPGTVDEPWLARWIERGRDPVMSAREVLMNAGQRRDALAAFLAEQRAFWLGRRLMFGMGHGDFCPGNVLFSPGKTETDATLSAIIDWEAATDDAPPGLDAMFMILTARALRSGEELGFVVRQMLEEPELSADEQQALAPLEPAWDFAYGSFTHRAALRALCGLAWWQHVTTNLTKAGRFSESALWSAVNIDRVLAVYAPPAARNRRKSLDAPRTAADTRPAEVLQVPAPEKPVREKTGLITAARVRTAAIAGTLVTAMTVWALSLPMVDASRMTDLGLPSILPPVFYLSLALLAFGFAWQVARHPAARVLPGLYLAGLVVVLHATPPLVYGILRYSWAWKHLGIVDYIQRHGTVDQTAPFLAAYHNWPGLFFVTAWIADLFGAGPTEIASVVQFTPVVLNLAIIPALFWVLGRFSDDRRLLLTAVWLFIAGNWIGQDYFSPQGFTFLLYVVLLGLFLGPLKGKGNAVLLAGPRFLQRRKTDAPAAAASTVPPSRLRHALLHGLALAIILAIVVTHQLTPLLVILSAGLWCCSACCRRSI